MTFLRRCWCSMRHHDLMLQFELTKDIRRMYLKCNSCPYESKGWHV
jgi:hypothetical protein